MKWDRPLLIYTDYEGLSSYIEKCPPKRTKSGPPVQEEQKMDRQRHNW